MFKFNKIRLGLVMVLVLSMFTTVTVHASNIEMTEEMIDPKIQLVQDLLDNRAAILNEMFLIQDKGGLSISEINEIDIALAKMGVEFLSEQQVLEQFPESKGDKSLALLGQTQSDAEINMNTPESNKNTWMSIRVSVILGGESYNIQRLIAQPKSQESPLTNLGSRIITYDTNWQAGVDNVLSVLGESAVGLIPGSTIALTLYDAVSGFVSGINRTTEVSVPHITYSWSGVTTAVFMYVRLESQSDDYQWLSLISTKTNTEVGYQIPKFDYEISDGNWGLTPVVVQGNRSIELVPEGYNDNSIALSVYRSGEISPARTVVYRIQISGAENTDVEYIYPCCPNYPFHCE